MPFSPLIGISFFFHLVLALADMAFSFSRKDADDPSVGIPFRRRERGSGNGHGRIGRQNPADEVPIFGGNPVFLPDPSEYDAFLLGREIPN